MILLLLFMKGISLTKVKMISEYANRLIKQNRRYGIRYDSIYNI